MGVVDRERDAGAVIADFFVLRAASAPLAQFIAWSAGLEAANLPPGQQRREALERDGSMLRARLRDVCTTPTFRQALYVASPTLDDSLERWLDGADGRRVHKVERALVRYFARMTGRAVPFGMFAGCAVGAIGDQTRLTLKPLADGTRRTRLDVGYVEQLRVALEKSPDVRSRLRFFPNSSLYCGGDQMRWIEFRMDGQRRSHHLISAPCTRYLDAITSLAQDGVRLDQLVAVLSELGVEPAAAQRYVDELTDSQVLVSELELPVTGEEPLDALVEGLRRAGVIGRWPQLEKLPQALADFDHCGGGPRAAYRALAAELSGLPVTPDAGRTFQVDLRRAPSKLTIGRDVVNELVRAATLLERINAPVDPLKSFREAFLERFDQRLIPLMRAIDSELGVGMGDSRPGVRVEPLLRRLPFPAGPAKLVGWGPREQFLLTKVQHAAASGTDELVLDDDDVRRLEVDEPAPLSHGFAVLAQLAVDSDTALAAGDFELFIQSVIGPSGAELLGRFAYADSDLTEAIRKHLCAVDRLDPESIHAEIAHLPEGRDGNVICRPVLREWEIPYLCRSGVAPERQIPVQDLLVGVRGEEVVLFSRRLRRRVVPRLSCAHNYEALGTPLYRFLCAAQTARASTWGWSWGPLSDAPFLPRVRVGRLVLSLCSWRLDKNQIRALSTGEVGDRFDAAQELRTALRLPRIVVLAEGDLLLPVDLNNVLCVDALGSALHDRDAAQLVELWPGPDRLVAQDDQGTLATQLVVPFRRCSQAHTKRPSIAPAEIDLAEMDDVTRRYEPGSEWLYLKLYTPAALADRVLTVAVRAALDTGAVRRWFFIRYADPADHLRVRFHGDSAALRNKVLPAVHAATAPLLRTDVLNRIVVDTYDRELERYGGPLGIELSEALFDVDSIAVLEVLQCLEPGDAGSEERWQIGLIGANMLLEDFRLRGKNAIELLKRLRDGYGAEFRADAPLAKALGERARSHRDVLAAAAGRVPPPDRLEPGAQILRRRSEALTPIIDKLHAAETTGQLTTPISQLVESYLHMHLNRILRSSHRAQELVIYDFLLRAHRSAVRR